MKQNVNDSGSWQNPKWFFLTLIKVDKPLARLDRGLGEKKKKEKKNYQYHKLEGNIIKDLLSLKD